jgi:hypothetical protein
VGGREDDGLTRLLLIRPCTYGGCETVSPSVPVRSFFFFFLFLTSSRLYAPPALVSLA